MLQTFGPEFLCPPYWILSRYRIPTTFVRPVFTYQLSTTAAPARGYVYKPPTTTTTTSTTTPPSVEFTRDIDSQGLTPPTPSPVPLDQPGFEIPVVSPTWNANWLTSEVPYNIIQSSFEIELLMTWHMTDMWSIWSTFGGHQPLKPGYLDPISIKWRLFITPTDSLLLQ